MQQRHRQSLARKIYASQNTCLAPEKGSRGDSKMARKIFKSESRKKKDGRVGRLFDKVKDASP
jgi:hypothetical protein